MAPKLLLRLVLSGLGIALAASLMWAATTSHLRRACIVMDTPYLPLCPPEAASPSAQREALRARLVNHPGDSGTWAQLLRLEDGSGRQPVLRAATALAPNDANVLRARAAQALDEKALPEATALLVQVIATPGGGEAAQILARILASGDGVALLRPHLPSAARWLPQVLGSMPALKLPLTSALPLVSEAAAQDRLPAEAVGAYIQSLKAGGQWADAHALWLARQRGPQGLLFNALFDQPLEPNGFDWELTPAPASRSGAVVNLRGMGERGQVLEVQYTGKAVAEPVIRQYFFAPPGRYTLRGDYMSRRLRMEQGLAWAVLCTEGSKPVAGRTTGLQDTAGAWQAFEFEFTIPAACGSVASLQLETFAPFEAAAGFRGLVLFDRFELRRQGRGPG